MNTKELELAETVRVRVPPELKNALEDVAARQGVTASALARQFLEAGLTQAAPNWRETPNTQEPTIEQLEAMQEPWESTFLRKLSREPEPEHFRQAREALEEAKARKGRSLGEELADALCRLTFGR